MKKTMYLWIVLIVGLLVGLTFIGFNTKKSNKIYKDLEKELIKTAQGYYGEQPSLLKNGAIIIDKELKDYKDSLNLELENDKCEGYVKVKSNMGIFEYKAFIKCNNYTTKGY